MTTPDPKAVVDKAVEAVFPDVAALVVATGDVRLVLRARAVAERIARRAVLAAVTELQDQTDHIDHTEG